MLGAAAEGKDPIDDVPRTLARLSHLLHMLPFPAVPTQLAQCHLGVAENGREDIVEVMGDAAGQGAERLHAPGMPQPQFECLLLPLGLLSAERAGKNLTDRAQQRDGVVCPVLLPLDRIEAQASDAISGVPQRNTEPGADAALHQPRFQLASWHCLNGRDVDAAMTLIHFAAPGRFSDAVLWAFASDCPRGVRPAIGWTESFATPGIGSDVQCIIDLLEDDTDAIHARVAAQLLEPLPDSVARPIQGRIDQLRRDAGNKMFEIRARLERTRIGAQPHIEMAEIDQQQHRREVEEHAKDPGERLGVAVILHEEILQKTRLLRNARREETRQNAVHGREHSQDQISVRAQRGDILPEAGGCGEDGELVQQGGDLGRLGLDHDRQVFAGFAGRSAESAAQMREVGQGVLRKCVGRLELFNQPLLLVQPRGNAVHEQSRPAPVPPAPRSSSTASRSRVTTATRGS